MLDFIISILIGLILIVIGVSNMRGNISSLHSYHTKRVKKEDVIYFGKKVGIGTIIIGCTIIIAGILEILINQNFSYLINIVLIIGFVPGLTMIFYALFKYNKGIF